jgi:hypothetical protein
MKPAWRDYAIILMGFAAVFLCGYGVGHLVGERHRPSPPSVESGATPAWERDTLLTLKERLKLRPEQVVLVQGELSLTAQAIGQSHDRALLDYHRHIDRLYGRLIELLDETQARDLGKEKKALEGKIRMLSDRIP